VRVAEEAGNDAGNITACDTNKRDRPDPCTAPHSHPSGTGTQGKHPAMSKTMEGLMRTLAGHETVWVTGIIADDDLKRRRSCSPRSDGDTEEPLQSPFFNTLGRYGNPFQNSAVYRDRWEDGSDSGGRMRRPTLLTASYLGRYCGPQRDN